MNPQSRLWSLLLVALFALPISAAEKPGEKKEKTDPALLTVARIFDSKDFEPQKFAARWLEDEPKYVTLDASKETSGGQDVVCHDPESGQREILVPAAHLVPPEESTPLKIDAYAFSKDRSLVLIFTNSKRVWRKNTRGDYWVLDRAGRELRKLGGDAKPSTLMFAKLSPTGRHVAYVRENNLYLEDLQSHEIKALTTSGSADRTNGTFDWVYEEEFHLRDGFAWSPDGMSIAYWQLNTEGVPEFAMINNTAGLYPRVVRFKHPKAGQRNPACRVGVVDIRDAETRWLDVPGNPRNHYIARMEWAEGSRQLLLQQLNRLQNTNRVMLADARDGSVRTILEERDDAWVDVHDELNWLSDGKRFTWVSERDGWRHVYLVSRSGKQVNLATPGDYDAIELLHVDEKDGWLYFLASPDNPTQRYLYRVRLDGTGLERLTPSEQAGTHDYQISPDARWAIHHWSSFDAPPTVELVDLPGHDKVRTLAASKSLRAKVKKLQRRPTEFFRVDIGDGVELDAWCIRPPDFDPKKKYPLLVYVYGEPWGQTVLDRWGGTRYLWHLMLAQQGYVVMSFDNRGTPAPRGRPWRKVIHRQVGILAPADQAAALEKVLAERSYLDPERVGIWGWSGGGSMTLNAIFKYPKLYQTAIAVAPVSNQRHYDTIYQERYMGLPGDNVDGYLKGSPINFAHQLEGNLLVIHGTGDDNVHYQSTEALADELIRHNRPFTMMAYPNRTHAIREGKNTTRHLRELMTRYLKENLPAGPRKK
ncbi:MAG TPA: DPP IV N-terminal domain-containing protein [Thermoguttaceae bacterium]|nr:DPP IV N-terminal domain-containing protein [Thermoguttaceae bacterium]